VWWESLTTEERRLIAEMPSVHRTHPQGREGVAGSSSFDEGIRDAILTAIHRAGSNLVLLPIQDIFGWRDRINHPATTGEWNWTYVLPWPLDRKIGRASCRERVQIAGSAGSWQQIDTR